MASYQQSFSNDPIKVLAKINNFRNSRTRTFMLDAMSYANGENVFINNVRKQYWSDKQQGVVDDRFSANNKIGYGFFKNAIRQKCSTLFSEVLTITNQPKAMSDKFPERMTNALMKAGIKASACGVAYILEDVYGNLTVFDTENCIPYFDDETGILNALVRFWSIKADEVESLYFEIYDTNGVVKYKSVGGAIPTEIQPLTAYKYTIKKSALTEQQESNNLSVLPIKILKNNDYMLSDLNSCIKSKIDIIDLVQSGFANNIADFSEIYLTINGSKGATSDDYIDFQENVRKLKTLYGDGDVHLEQLQIPTEARTKFVEIMKSDLVEDYGSIDVKSMTGGSLTTTAIKAATLGLKQTVMDFYPNAYETATELVELWQRYNNIEFDFNIEMPLMLIQNDTEILQNLVSIQNMISQRSRLELIKRAGYIEDVDKEMQQLEEESAYTLEDTEPIETGTEPTTVV